MTEIESKITMLYYQMDEKQREFAFNVVRYMLGEVLDSIRKKEAGLIINFDRFEDMIERKEENE